MRSGNGRHRRPRTAPAIVVTAGATGAGLALPLLGASGAQAAEAGTWDRVAKCESDGMWSADEGNGYFGGLQLTMDMWQDHGGEEFADRPDYASRAQQITVAERILADEGARIAWPSCADGAGLERDDRKPEVDPGTVLPPLPEPAQPGWDGDGAPGEGRGKHRGGGEEWPGSRDAGKDGGSGKEGGSGKDGKDGKGPVQESGEWYEGDQDAGERGEGKGRHRAPTQGREWVEDIGEGAAGSASGAERAGEDQRESGPAKEKDRDDRYTVRPGDSLAKIAREHSLKGGWAELYDGNKGSLGTDPDDIAPGQHLKLGRK